MKITRNQLRKRLTQIVRRNACVMQDRTNTDDTRNLAQDILFLAKCVKYLGSRGAHLGAACVFELPQSSVRAIPPKSKESNMSTRDELKQEILSQIDEVVPDDRELTDDDKGKITEQLGVHPDFVDDLVGEIDSESDGDDDESDE